MTKQHLLKLAAVAGIAAYLAACSYFESDWPAIKAEQDRKPAPNFTLTDAAGKPAQLSDYRGKVVLLNFWATWCGPCEVEIPWFIQFQREYKDRDFVVVGVSEDEDGWKSVRPFVAREKINYPVMIATELVTQQYGGIDHLPTTFMIDRQGRVASSHLGLVSMGTYRKEILTLLGDATNDKNPVVSDNRLPAGFWAVLRRPGR
jgi:peroxiredoxin